MWQVGCPALIVSFPRKRESSSFVDPRLRGDDGWLRRQRANGRQKNAQRRFDIATSGLRLQCLRT
jgi:hypothetical protein